MTTQYDIFNLNSNNSTYTDQYSQLLSGKNYIYIFHLPSDQTGEGTYLYLPQWPEEIQDKITSSFQSQNALSRPAPIQVYQNSGPREMQFSITLHRDMMDEANAGVVQNLVLPDTDDYVDYFIKTIQSIALPNYHSANQEVEPPMVAVRFGDEVFIKGVVNGGISVTYKKPLLSNNKYALVTIGFSVTEVDPMDAVSISKVGSFRNISKTFREFD